MRSNLSIAANAGLVSPPYCQISRAGAWPCTRMSGRNVACSNQRVASSRHSTWSAAAWGLAAKRGGTANPPLSSVQYGMPDSENPSPAGICLRIAVQVAEMSPDHVAAA